MLLLIGSSLLEAMFQLFHKEYVHFESQDIPAKLLISHFPHVLPTLPHIHSSDMVRPPMGSQQNLPQNLTQDQGHSPISRLSKVCLLREWLPKSKFVH